MSDFRTTTPENHFGPSLLTIASFPANPHSRRRKAHLPYWVKPTLPYGTIRKMAARSRKIVDISVIGLGNWGSSLVPALTSAGIPLREVIVRRKRRSRLPLTTWRDANLEAGILWLCVPDSAIPAAVKEIVRRRPSLSGQIVVHSSGALTVAALETAKRAGAQVASVHPVMTFPTRDVISLHGVFFGIEVEDAVTRKILYSLLRRLGGKPFDLRSEDKAMYHAAGTLASPLLVSALTVAMEAARLAGLDEKTSRRWVQSLAEPTMRNVFARGPEKSFSGPFARGDAETIRLHLQALQEHPILAAVYRSLAGFALDALPVKKSETLAKTLHFVSRPRREKSNE
ncbi:putative short-subunit dehydrogenase-like oxidoreductase (DUF2520 family) [Silvibacterium bohemicum]|uniref:Putative short-subunit dehydrogenase-like oxidoreductase (DUF2520 family) n=1 Tax=Silvibacterium bohemicum TaxID=1577686 RepID=A0A841JVE6_9BACT|nr:DUF2520 domain-containing protein [Silvibacterium bohemicum]MBB6142408.1 putative short-subunit dehydrogenase-like oxidoreductase (DUF2520 family) [Silvibacterium bohemicum]